LVFACAGRFPLAQLLAPLEEAGGPLRAIRRMGWAAPATLGVALLVITALPVSAELSLHSVEPAPELPDGWTPKLTLTVGSGPGFGSWAVDVAGSALPPSGNATPVSASAPVWILPPIPLVLMASYVVSPDTSITQAR